MQNVPVLERLQEALPKIRDIEFLKEGGFKAVYKGTIEGATEAIKVIYIPEVEDEDEEPSVEEEQNRNEMIGRVKREVKSLDRCRRCEYLVHLGNLQPFMCQIDGCDYMIYSEEFLDGPTLHARIREGHRPDFAESKLLTICLLKAIEVMRNKDLIHRDIKPSNIIALDDPDRPFVILDLGIAFERGGTSLTRNPSLRQGTLPYMAPEMFDPRFRVIMDYRSDLYSAGVTVYEYVSGIHPIARKADDEFTTVGRITNVTPDPLISRRDDLPGKFCQLIDQLVKKLPALRPADIGRTLNRLEEIS